MKPKNEEEEEKKKLNIEENKLNLLSDEKETKINKKTYNNNTSQESFGKTSLNTSIELEQKEEVTECD